MVPDVGIPHYPVGTAVAGYSSAVNPRRRFLLLLESLAKLARNGKNI
jgi:hypothetical protein